MQTTNDYSQSLEGEFNLVPFMSGHKWFYLEHSQNVFGERKITSLIISRDQAVDLAHSMLRMVSLQDMQS